MSPLRMIFCKVETVPSFSPRLFAATASAVKTVPNRCMVMDQSPSGGSSGCDCCFFLARVAGQGQQCQIAALLPFVGVVDQPPDRGGVFPQSPLPARFGK